MKFKVWDLVKSRFKFLKSYSIENSLISVYYSDSFKITVSSAGAGHDGRHAFDGSTEPDNFWEGGGFPIWLSLAYPKEQKITSYAFYSGYTAADEMPKDWKFQGSNDEVNWVDLDERKDETGWQINSNRKYTVAKPSTYLYYRFYFTTGNHPAAVRIYEIKVE